MESRTRNALRDDVGSIASPAGPTITHDQIDHSIGQDDAERGERPAAPGTQPDRYQQQKPERDVSAEGLEPDCAAEAERPLLDGPQEVGFPVQSPTRNQCGSDL